MSQTGADPDALGELLFDLWSCKNLEGLRLQASRGFSEMQEPLVGLLALLGSSPGPQKGRSSTLGHFLLTEFVRWMRGNPQASLKNVAADRAAGLQRWALGLISDSQPGYVDALLDIYQLGSLDRELLVKHVHYMQDCCSYKEAALLAMKLELQAELDMEKMCVPLVLLDKLQLAESYVHGHAELQERLVVLLDSWCSPDFSLENLCRLYLRLSLSKHQADQIQPKMLTKHVFRLMERFRVDPAKCPNSVYKRKLDSLRFLAYKRFVEKTMSVENWRDHVQAAVEGCTELQINLVELLNRYSIDEAAQWAHSYNLPRERLPFDVREVVKSLPPSHTALLDVCDQSSEAWEATESHRERFYQPPIAKDKVHFVSVLEELESCKKAVMQSGTVVGVDMEWRAGFGTVSQQRVSLVQLAAPGQVFLLDLCAPGFSQHVLQFLRQLLCASSILKLGYGMSGDLKCLVATWPEIRDEPLKVEGVLDLLHVHQQIQRGRRAWAGPRSVEVAGGPAEKGLSLLVQQVLGRPLDKEEQLSNWERRPLRTSQLRYAVADAYCLLDVYSVLSEDPASFGLPADLRSVSSSTPAKSKEEKRAKDKMRRGLKKSRDQSVKDPSLSAVGTEQEKPGSQGPCLAPQDLHVVCDNMLQGLGRFLRCLGVDVRMLENVDDHRVAAELKSQVGEGRCLALDCSEKARDQAVRVLKHFNIRLTPQDIFSRCQACNSNEYLRLSREEMTRILKEKGLLRDQPLTCEEVWDDPDEPVASYNSNRDPRGPEFTPHCRWAPHADMDPRTLTFPSGAALQFETVPPGLISRIPEYFICTGCGKVFWEGTHFDRVLRQFEEVLHVSEDKVSMGTCVTSQESPRRSRCKMRLKRLSVMFWVFMVTTWAQRPCVLSALVFSPWPFSLFFTSVMFCTFSFLITL
ncbi:exonuclease mut-7 homolog isoform X2 [Denticeps clupeoides]|uniref:3'-5' exonuclease domain-containing protein n=1 Tax=Denticeps clupeoides TaxID=299321 RepID=A0AAY4ABG4_9TELE|nr:exonuclease mut-7 homolog isoform X2 [Denticeps clupeoides]